MAGQDHRAASAATITVFSVTADRSPQLLCRLLGLIAQQDRLVHSLTVTSSRHRHRLALEIRDLDPHRAAIIADRMRGLVHVRAVRLRFLQGFSSP